MCRRRLGEFPAMLVNCSGTVGAAMGIVRLEVSPLIRLQSVGNPWWLQRAFASGGSSGSSSYSAKGPSQQLKSWESGARLVQNTTVENKYLEHIREVHDPTQHLKTIEDELKGTIGKALGKQGEKVLLYARLMEAERQKYAELVEQLEREESLEEVSRIKLEQQIQQHATSHNEYREECLHARWELIVHRQAVGFIVGNHKYVTEKFPIAEALPVQGDILEESSNLNEQPKPSKKTFSDQLDWWQRIGRWK